LAGSIFKHLLMMLGAPLFAAATGQKKKPLKPAVKKKPAQRARARSTSARRTKRRVARPARPKRPARKPKATRPGKAAPPAHKAPVPPTPIAKPEVSEPPPKPAAPNGRAILLSPENEKFTDSLHPTFRWLSVGGATRYEVTWGEDPGLTQAHAVVSIATEATVPVEKPLRVGVAYYWRVRGGNEGGWGPWSSSATFRVLAEEGS